MADDDERTLVEFYLEHRRCGELESGGVEEDRVWMTCTCGAPMVRPVKKREKECRHGR